MEDDLRLARRLAEQAAAILQAGAGRPHAAERKSSATDLVTDYDRRAEALIVAGLRADRPTDHVVAEEGGSDDKRSDRRWLIDPLDGTTNFAHGLPFFCVSIALEVGGELVVGVIDAPALGWHFYSVRGQGAFLVEKGAAPRRLRVSETAVLSSSLLATGFPYDRQTSADNNFAQFIALQKCAQAVRRVGSAALDLAMTAAGWFDGYWELKLKPWDLAAGALLVQEAGGKVTTWSGGRFFPDCGQAVASNGAIHDELLEALARS